MSEFWARGNWWEDVILKRTKPPYGPVNTITNLVYIIIGIASLWTFGDPIFAAAMIWLGIGSGLYHAFKTSWAASMDDSGMYAVLGYLAVMSWQGALFGAAFGLIRYKPGWFRSVNLVHSIGIVFAIVMLQAGLASWLAVLFFGVAYLIWNAGKYKWDNDDNPDTIPWYAKYCHGTWHLLTGIGFYLLMAALL